MEKIRILDPNSDFAKKLLESEKRHEAIREAIRSGKKISDIAKEFGFKFVDHLKVYKEHKRKEIVINIVKEEMKTKLKYKR